MAFLPSWETLFIWRHNDAPALESGAVVAGGEVQKDSAGIPDVGDRRAIAFDLGGLGSWVIAARYGS